jgi:broad specificity phosphatase PhoE
MGRNPVELSENGRTQVEAAARFAQALKPDLIVTSPLVRARQSAEIMSAGLGGVALVEDAAIAEVLYGRWEGMTYRDLVDDAHYLEYRKSPIEHPTPGGETIPEVQARGIHAINRAVEVNSDKRILFVSHGDIIRTVLCHFMGLELKYFHRLRVDNASISGIQIAGNFAELKFLNLLPDPARAFLSPFETNRPTPVSTDQK